ncbi:MAG: isoprenyl transferase [Alphaproteobacteria bacterium]|nr:isoprenyl transferase [Alphaproteobacteria bacterium]
MEPAPSSFPGSARPPTHIAVIMDGNGRWAAARGLPRIAGHQRGAAAVRVAVEACRELGVSYLTLYAFSSENWKRPPAEIDDLMRLLRLYLRRELAELDANGVRVRFIGQRAPLPPDIVDLIAHAEARTRGNEALTLVVALNYGGRDEIVRACRSLAAEVAAGRLAADRIDIGLFSRHLETCGIPDPDLIIRTSGEQRLSNFLLWQAAYSEFVFVDTHWPDFNRETLEDAVLEFHRRERRYGAVGG